MLSKAGGLSLINRKVCALQPWKHLVSLGLCSSKIWVTSLDCLQQLCPDIFWKYQEWHHLQRCAWASQFWVDLSPIPIWAWLRDAVNWSYKIMWWHDAKRVPEHEPTFNSGMRWQSESHVQSFPHVKRPHGWEENKSVFSSHDTLPKQHILCLHTKHPVLPITGRIFLGFNFCYCRQMLYLWLVGNRLLGRRWQGGWALTFSLSPLTPMKFGCSPASDFYKQVLVPLVTWMRLW